MKSEVCNIITRNNSNFYQTLSHLTVYHKDSFYMGIKVYNSLLPEIQDFSHNIKKLKASLRGFLHQHSFYTLEGYFNYTAAIGYILTTKLIFIFCLFV